jgi:hypothetical protein
MVYTHKIIQDFNLSQIIKGKTNKKIMSELAIMLANML